MKTAISNIKRAISDRQLAIGATLFLLLVGVALAQEQAPGWDPIMVCPPSYIVLDAVAAAVFGPIVGLVIGLAGPWRARWVQLRVGRIYPLAG
jgi:hypothetical protein